MGGLSHTVSGDIASFRTPSRVPIESLKFHFLPKQAAGTPSPENPIPIEGWTGLNGKRSGRNLLNPFTNPIWVGWDTFYTINSDGSVTISDSDWRAWGGNDISPFPLPKGTYTFSWYGADRIQITTSDKSYNNATLYYRSTTGGHVSFTLSSDGGVKFKLFGDYPLTCTVQIEPGLVAHDYVPYSEKSPIEQIPITFPSNGKNLYDISSYPLTQGRILWADDGTVDSGYSQFASTLNYIPCENIAGKTVTLNKRPGGWYGGVAFYIDSAGGYSYISGVRNNNQTAGTPMTFVVPKNAKYMRFSVPANTTDIQIELGEESTAFEPHSSDNTFYGGYIDPVAGEIVAEYGFINSTWGAGANNTVMGNTERRRYPLLGPTPSGAQYETQKCNVAKYGYDFGADYVHVYCAINSNGYLFLPIDTDDDTAIQITYKLATPIHIPIPAEDLKAFLDHNNFWSDANDITEVTYAVTESKDILATRKKAMDFDHAHHKKVKWNNMAGAMNDQYWIRYNPNMIDVDFENNEALITVKDTSSMPFSMSIRTNGDPTVYSNHRYYVSYCLYPYFDNAYFGAEFGNNVYTGYFYFEKDKWSRFSYRSKAGGDGLGRMYIPYFKPSSYAIGDSVRIKNAYYIDLTLMFGAGNEPTTAAEFERICELNGIDLTTYQPYDEGSDRWLIIP